MARIASVAKPLPQYGQPIQYPSSRSESPWTKSLDERSLNAMAPTSEPSPLNVAA